jgi:hypothetical protein
MPSLHIRVGNVGHLKNRQRSWYETYMSLCIASLVYRYVRVQIFKKRFPLGHIIWLFEEYIFVFSLMR